MSASGDASDLRRAALVVSALNLVSRATGFVRIVATASALGIAVLGDAYHRANQVSNVLFELLAGGMLFSALVPSFVVLLRDGDHATARRLASVLTGRAIVLLGVVVAVGLALRRPLMEALTAGVDDGSRAAQVELGAFLLWFVLPQLLLYLVGAVATGLLHAAERFVAAAVAPVCNNLVVTATMVSFAVVHDPARGLALTEGEKLLLGGGTLAGVVAMSVVPSIAAWRAGLGFGVRWRADGVDLAPIVRRGAWGVGHVGVNQVLLLATIVLAGAVPGGAIAFQSAFAFFLLPHALLAHPIFTTIYPRLARHGDARELVSFHADLRAGVGAMVGLLLPAAALMAVAAVPAASLVDIGQFDAEGARLVAFVLAAYLTGIGSFSTYFLLTRASYALDDARTPTTVNAAAAGACIVAMVLLSRAVDGTALLVGFGIAHAVAMTGACVALARRLSIRVDRPLGVAPAVARSMVLAVGVLVATGGAVALVGWSTSGTAVVATMAALAAGGAVAVLGGRQLGLLPPVLGGPR